MIGLSLPRTLSLPSPPIPENHRNLLQTCPFPCARPNPRPPASPVDFRTSPSPTGPHPSWDQPDCTSDHTCSARPRSRPGPEN